MLGEQPQLLGEQHPVEVHELAAEQAVGGDDDDQQAHGWCCWLTEEALTGDAAASVEAAVTAAYPDATINRMETDADGAAYEAHITLADGSELTVELDASFAITSTESATG